MKSSGERLRFGDYTLDPDNRVLLRGEMPVELGSRYFDALQLLVGSGGQLVTKDRLHEEVWRGVPVTDEALTQCIRALRRALGDDAANPRFIETVPKHGYRFVAPLQADTTAPLVEPLVPQTQAEPAIKRRLMLTGGGGLGGAAAGALIGLIYGLSLARGEQASGAGLSLVAVIACCGALAGLFSGLAISGGIAVAERLRSWGGARMMIGGAAGGLTAGSVLNMLGRDAIGLLFGRRVADLAGGLEGLVLGAVIGGGLWWLRQRVSRNMGAVLPVGLAGAAAGLILPLVGGTLFAGSLAALAASVPNSPFTLPPLLNTAGTIGEALGGAFEGALFTIGVTVGLSRAGAAPTSGT